MATTVSNAQIGQMVYEYGKPQNPGVIRKIVQDETLEYPKWPGNYYRVTMVEVEWLKKSRFREKVTTVNARHLHDFNALMEDHRRKHENMKLLANEMHVLAHERK